MDRDFDFDDLVWAKFKNYRPWPGRIIRQEGDPEEDHLCVQFYGNDDHSEIPLHNIYPYLERVDEFTANIPKNYGSSFNRAINTIHEKYWDLVDLKRDCDDSGFPIDREEEIQHAIEDHKAGLWNPRVLRRALPPNQDDDEIFYDDDEEDNVYPDPSWGRSKCKRLRKDKKGACVKQVKHVTGTKISSKKTRSKTETSCRCSQASTSSQSCKASYSCQNSNASTSVQNSKTSFSNQNKKATPGQSCKCATSMQSSKTSSKAPLTKRQKSLHALRASTHECTCQNVKASTSQVKTGKSKSSETLCLPKKGSHCQNVKTSTLQIKISKCKSSETSSLAKKEVTCQSVTDSTTQVKSKKRKSCEKEDVKPSTSKAACLSNSEQLAQDIHSCPLYHLSLKASPVDKIKVPQGRCSECTIRYGFIGLGPLSQSLIYPLLKGGHIVNVWSKDGSKFNALTKAGAVRTNTPARIITSSDIIFYSTKDPDISKNILLTKEGVFDGCARCLGVPKIFIELTNIDIVEPERNIRPIIKYQGGKYLQMKSIMPQVNENAALTFICAGELRVFAAVTSCLYHVTRDIHYFGLTFFMDAPMDLTPSIVEELVLQSLQKTTTFLYDLGFRIPDFEKVICHHNFDFRKIAAKLKEINEAKRKKIFRFYEDM